MTASGTVGQECAGGNCATAGRRQRKKKGGGGMLGGSQREGKAGVFM